MRQELETKAIEILEASLKPLPHEKNDLDWKAEPFTIPILALPVKLAR